MNEMPPTFSTRMWQAWTRLPKYGRLVCAFVVAIAVVMLTTFTMRTPAMAPAASATAAVAEPMRDTSVPDASRALSRDDRQQEVSTPTF